MTVPEEGDSKTFLLSTPDVGDESVFERIHDRDEMWTCEWLSIVLHVTWSA